MDKVKRLKMVNDMLGSAMFLNSILKGERSDLMFGEWNENGNSFIDETIGELIDAINEAWSVYIN